MNTQTGNFSKFSVADPPHILSVDDEEDNLLLSIFVLENLGYPCIGAIDGHSALELVDRYRPALILLDMALPGISGFEVVRRLKQNAQTAAIPVIAVTAMVMQGDRERILAAGCDDYIRKPYMLEDLESLIELHLNRSFQELGQLSMVA